MPAQYEAIRDALVKRGRPYDTAQRIAAATYNARHPGHPMGPHTDRVNQAVREHLKRKHQ